MSELPRPLIAASEPGRCPRAGVPSCGSRPPVPSKVPWKVRKPIAPCKGLCYRKGLLLYSGGGEQTPALVALAPRSERLVLPFLGCIVVRVPFSNVRGRSLGNWGNDTNHKTRQACWETGNKMQTWRDINIKIQSHYIRVLCVDYILLLPCLDAARNARTRQHAKRKSF